LLVLFVLVAAGFFGALHPARAEERITIRPNGSFERCIELKQGESLMYSFTSDAPVNFDMHYHADGKTRYPLKKDSVSEHRGTFTARSPHEYCLYWNNPTDQPLEIVMDFRVGGR
jgi:hypothetical protein